ncbi:MAG: type II toxin-antitoxin system RelE/ParE family toxin [Bacteroidota bacterium]
MAFYLTRKAEADLRDIARYTQSKWGIRQRNTYLTQIDNAFHDLANEPDKGRNCDDIRLGYFKYRVSKHFIFYRMIDSGDIEIVRVLHERMNFETHLNN